MPMKYRSVVLNLFWSVQQAHSTFHSKINFITTFKRFFILRFIQSNLK